MSTRVQPDFLLELKKYGAVGIEQCFNCGNCTAICPLTSDEHPFPRNMIRLSQLGLRDRLLGSTDPWLCYYCGECSTTCPRGAEPAESMMALRRWLTAQYDRTGHGAKLYTSEKAVAWTVLRVMLITLAFFVALHLLKIAHLPTAGVALNTFAPVMWVWGFVLLHGAYLFYRMLSGVFQMGQHVAKANGMTNGIPFGIWLGEVKTFVIHFFTQKRWRACGHEDNSRWFKHWLLVSGYVSMLVLVLVFLWWFQTDNIYPLYHPQRWIGYYATVVLIYSSTEALIGRYKKREQIHRFSHPTDWLFPVFILIGSVTGILVHLFRYAGWPWMTYSMYVIHVMAMIAMLDTEVGIGKWAHLFYRPLAMYLEAVKEKAKAISQRPIPDTIPVGD